jgi:hypothetical protein
MSHLHKIGAITIYFLTMSRQNNEKTVNYNISGAYGALLGRPHHDILSPGGHGGPGGPGHGNGGLGGSGGTGEGPTVNIDNSTNKMYVGEVSPFLFPNSFLNRPASMAVHSSVGM